MFIFGLCFILYSDNYSKISGFLWQYCRYELVLDGESEITDFMKLMLLLIRIILK